MQAFLGKLPLTEGSRFTAATAKGGISIGWTPQPGVRNAIIMYDLDAPDGIFLHYLLVNIPQAQLKKGKVLMDYSPPAPSDREHRYVLALLQQRQPYTEGLSQIRRTNFNVQDFLVSQNMSPIAAITFVVQPSNTGSSRSASSSLLPRVGLGKTGMNMLAKPRVGLGGKTGMTRRSMPREVSPPSSSVPRVGLGGKTGMTRRDITVNQVSLPKVVSPINSRSPGGSNPGTANPGRAKSPAKSASPRQAASPRKARSPRRAASPRKVTEAAYKKTMIIPKTDLSQKEQSYCRCVLEVGAKQPGACNLEKAWFHQKNGETCYNPYAVCAKSVGTSTRECGENYNYEKLSDEHLIAFANLHGIKEPKPYNKRTMLKKISDWKKLEGK